MPDLATETFAAAVNDRPPILLTYLTEGIKTCVTLREAAPACAGAKREAAYWVKRRRWTAPLVLSLANAFFRLAHAPVRTIPDAARWRAWECESFLLLHGAEGFDAFVRAPATAGTEEVPGQNLTDFLDGGRMEPHMAAAAGWELRRAHALVSPVLGARWSHGDPHAGNFILEEATGRARLIDYDVMHCARMPERDRHGDDVLVFLLDVVGRIEPERWQPCATAFLEAYGDAGVLARLPALLRVPRHPLARLWWYVRTTFLPVREYERRVEELLASRVFERSGAVPQAATEEPALAGA